jgi:DNA modification methylase
MNNIGSELIDRVLNNNGIAGMKKLPDGCIPMTMTSPPYDKLREFGGHPWDFESFIPIAEELYRITMQGGVVVWIVADSIIDGSETGTSARQKLRFLEIGFNAHHTMVMHRKGSRWPSKVRYGDSLEYAFVLSKGKPRTIKLLRDKPNKHAGMVQTFNRRELDGRQRPTGTSQPVKEMGVRSAIWTYAAGGPATTKDNYAFNHPALMPERMAEDHIRSWSRIGDLIFDPMCGAGTTCKMALLNHRRYLGFEVHEPYHRLAESRMTDAHEEYRWRFGDSLGA